MFTIYRDDYPDGGVVYVREVETHAEARGVCDERNREEEARWLATGVPFARFDCIDSAYFDDFAIACAEGD